MEFVKNIDDVVANLKTLEAYLKSKKKKERAFAQDLIRGGKTILMYKVNGAVHFAPSRFCGYLNNTMQQHVVHEEKDGRETDPGLDSILKGKARFLERKEVEFLAYCALMGLDVPDNSRRYWRVGTHRDPFMDITA
jgi:putative restriction endonuclease